MTTLAKNDALWLCQRLIAEFPGLYDGDTEVDGADLIQFLTKHLVQLKALRRRVCGEYAAAIEAIDATPP